MIELNLQLTKEDVDEINALTKNPQGNEGVLFEKESTYVGKYAACFTVFHTSQSETYSAIGLSYDLGDEGVETVDIEDYSVEEGSKTVFLKDYDNDDQCVVAKINIII